MTAEIAEYTAPASEAELEQLAARLRERNFEPVIVDSAAAAKAAVLERLPRAPRFTLRSPRRSRTSVWPRS